MVKSYINLTNGIEAFENAPYDFYDGFIRIQSTACEQKRWDFLLQELDTDFLMNIALGNSVRVVDYGASKETSRAVYQGIEFIKFVLKKHWLGITDRVIVRHTDSTNYFEEVYRNLSKRTLRKLDYFKKFVKTDTIDLVGFSDSTIHDGDYDYYVNLLWEARKDVCADCI